MQQTSFKTIFYRALREAGYNRFTCSLLADVIDRFLRFGFLPHDPREQQALDRARAIVMNSDIRPGHLPEFNQTMVRPGRQA
ncbi:MAG: hypothetical protein F6K19_50470 [Cyanothece sp. SIO1E1]|nr:hypothetical protein [Cyanothece sp. SIO1E1]